MMNLRQRQRGIGWFGLLFVFGMIAFVVTIGLRCTPIYLNQMKIAKAIHNVANNRDLAGEENGQIYTSLSRYWDIDLIDNLAFKDVKINRTDRGKTLSYKYEARAPLFYNISIVIDFQDSVPMVGGG
jgi:hypothetical protein